MDCKKCLKFGFSETIKLKYGTTFMKRGHKEHAVYQVREWGFYILMQAPHCTLRINWNTVTIEHGCNFWLAHLKGPSINDVGSWEEGRGQKLVKIANG